MEKLIAFGSILAVAVSATAADPSGLYVGRAGFATNHVASGTSSYSGEGMLAAGGEIRKTGVGTWAVNTALFPWADGILKVNEGTVALTLADRTGARPARAVPAVLARASYWLDASLLATRTDLFVKGTGTGYKYVYDAREQAGRSAPAYLYGQANFTASFDDAEPVAATYAGKTGLYFGGYASGRHLQLVQPGGTSFAKATNRAKTRAVFAVYAVSNSFGRILGSAESTGNSSFATGGSSASAQYFSDMNECENTVANGWTYENGQRIDPNVTPVRRGSVTLFNHQNVYKRTDDTSHELKFDCLFGQGNNLDCSGGDYLYEFVAFTNVISEAEREAVTAYLMDKWQIRTAPAKRVALAEGARLTVAANETDAAPVVVSGDGTVEVSSAQPVTIRVDREGGFGGTVSLVSGTVRASDGVAFAVPDGVNVRAAATNDGSVVSVTSGTAGQLVKSGDGTLVVKSLPAATRRVTVEGGTLSVSKREADAVVSSASGAEVAIPNASFEDSAEAYPTTVVWSPSSGAPFGWSGSFYNINLSIWTNGVKGVDGASRSAWGGGVLLDAPDGKAVLGMRGNSAWTSATVTLPAAGTYVLSGWMSDRHGDNIVHVYMTPGGAGTDVRIGRLMPQVCDAYEPFAIRFTVTSSGTHTLKFANDSSNSDTITLIDNLRLRRMEDRTDGIVAVPHGDLEEVSYARSATSGKATYNVLSDAAEYVPTGWSFTRGTADHVGVAVTIAGMGVHRHIAVARPDTGDAELYFVNPYAQDAQAAVTFTMPASGTYYLRATDRRHGGFVHAAAACATVGTAVYDLGTVMPFAFAVPTKENWPRPFTAQAGDTVEIRLTASRSSSAPAWYTSEVHSGIHFDDFELVPVDNPSVELVCDGSFEQANAAWKLTTYLASWEGVGASRYSSGAAGYGYSRGHGNYMMRLQNRVGISQSVTFPRPGCYRASFLGHVAVSESNTTSPTGDGAYNPQTIRMWYTDGGAVTNEIARYKVTSHEFAEYAQCFYVPVAGTYTFGVEGMSHTISAGRQSVAMIDLVSVRPVSDAGAADDFEKGLVIDVAEGAKLDLSFVGTNCVERLKLGGQSVRGVISASTHPDYITGTGSLAVMPTKGLIIFFK